MNNSTIIKTESTDYKINSSFLVSTNITQEISTSTLNINTTNPQKISTIKTTIPINSTVISNNDDKNKSDSDTFDNPITIYNIFFLQIQLHGNKIFIYILVDFKIPDDFIINITIIIYIRKSLRNLDEFDKIEKEIPVCRTNEGNGGLVEFSSDINDIIGSNNIANIEMKDLNVNSQGEENTFYDIILGDNNNLKNTEKVEELINNGGTNFSQVINKEINYTISQYKIESASKGCNFELKTDKKINSNQNVTLTFEKFNGASGATNANCSLLSNSNKIKCSLNKTTNDNYLLKDYIKNNENEILTIISKNKINGNYSLSCKINNIDYYINNKDKDKSLPTSIIIIIIVCGVVLLCLITVITIYIKRSKSKGLKEENDGNLNETKMFTSSSSMNQIN